MTPRLRPRFPPASKPKPRIHPRSENKRGYTRPPSHPQSRDGPPRARRPASYSAQLVTRCRCFGMWRRQAALALNGTAGIQASGKGPLSYTAQLPTPTGRSVQQGDLVIVACRPAPVVTNPSVKYVISFFPSPLVLLDCTRLWYYLFAARISIMIITTMRTVFRLALRQTEGLIGSVLQLRSGPSSLSLKAPQPS